MKTINSALIATTLLFLAPESRAQSGYNNETISAETFVRMANHAGGPFAISPVKIENANNGFTVKWQTVNENDIASFELQISDNKKNFTSVKTMAPGELYHPANIYEVDLNASFIHTEKTYFRVKTNFTSGKSAYTDTSVVKIKKTK